ncbi:hypothetical protein OG350_19905 [Streptomyces achromogenes]|uniref:McrBC 5-methylcytosine restriction system component n=1 Tax=Streptomyces achromogenes TaxID=67255 RepID=A0ABZ1KPB8_STRAH
MANDAVRPSAAGLFEGEGRRHAVYGALPLLCTYFSEGQRDKLQETDAGVTRSDGEEDPEAKSERMVAGLRLRVALALAKSLLRILDSVLDRPNFRYGVTRTTSFDKPRGKLDVIRWVTQLREVRVPEAYPILSVERSSRTPENLLACHCLTWFLEEIESAYTASAVPRKSAESEAVIHTIDRIGVILKRPDVSECREIVRRERGRQWVDDLLEEVDLRLASGRVGNREPYEELVRWARGIMTGNPALDPGDLSWLFYDNSFDDKLFELWCMHQLARALADRLGEEEVPIPDLQKSRSAAKPTWEWNFGQYRLELRFQYSLSKSVPALAWKGTEGLVLDGRPDMTLLLYSPDVESPRIVFVDPKLRKRDGLPTEEVYKMVGYFSAAGVENAGQGAIIYYTPHLDPQPVHTLRSAENGLVLAVGADPTRPDDSRAGFAEIASLVLPDDLIGQVSADS